MDRRDFLKMLGLGAAVVAAPKFIFDMGANLYKRERLLCSTSDPILWDRPISLTNNGMLCYYTVLGWSSSSITIQRENLFNYELA